MSFAILRNRVYINYGSQPNKPAGGFRFYYNPAVAAVTVTKNEPSFAVGLGDENVTDDILGNRLIVQLPVLQGVGGLPMVQMAEAAGNRTLRCAVAPVNASGEIGNLGAGFDLTVAAPTLPGTFTIANAP